MSLWRKTVDVGDYALFWTGRRASQERFARSRVAGPDRGTYSDSMKLLCIRNGIAQDRIGDTPAVYTIKIRQLPVFEGWFCDPSR
jgi:hypothetical protein